MPTLPFFALSWILTLFSHDIDTLPPVQRIFDYLIARNPISAIYLAVAILMSKRPQLLKLIEQHPEADQDPSLLHPLFARLPPLYPDTPDAPEPPAPGVSARSSARSSARPSRVPSRATSRGGQSPGSQSQSQSRSRSRSRLRNAEKPRPTEKAPLATDGADGADGDGGEADEKAAIRAELERSTTLAPPDGGDEKAALRAALDGPILAELAPAPAPVAEALVSEKLTVALDADADTGADADAGLVVESVDVELELDAPVPRERERERAEDANPFAPLVLSDVFALADGLMAKYPWDGPDVRGREVLGPGSCVRTFEWERRGRPATADAAADAPADADGETRERETAEEPGESDGSEDASDGSDGVRTPRACRSPFTHADAEACIDADVIVPGGDEMDDLEEDAPLPPPVKRVPRHFLSQLGFFPGKFKLSVGNFGAALALGIIVVGLGAVVLGWRRNTAWAMWWGHIAQGWIRRSQLSRVLALLG